MHTSCHRQLLLTLLLAASLTQRASAFGIDKLSLDVDASKDFSSVAKVVLFNDNDETVYVTGRALTWSNDVSGQMITAPTEDLAISPPVARIPAKGSTSFAVRYVGPKREGESSYRAAFKEVRVPALAPADRATGKVQPQIMTGLVMTIPVFVSDFAVKAVPFKNVTATFHRTGDEMAITVKNGGDRHVIVESVHLAGQEAKRLHSTVFAHKEIRYEGIKAPHTAQDVTLDLSYGKETQRIDVSVEK